MGTTRFYLQENLPQFFTIRSTRCKFNRGYGFRLRLEHIHIPSGIKISHGPCLECRGNSYMGRPGMKRIVLERLR